MNLFGCTSSVEELTLNQAKFCSNQISSTKDSSNDMSAGNHVSAKKKKRSDYAGISFEYKKWRPKLMHDSKSFRMGSYKLETDAAFAYDIAAKQIRGSKAKTNFASLNDYEKAKKSELAKSGLSNDDAMSSAAIDVKVNEILRTSASIASAKTLKGEKLWKRTYSKLQVPHLPHRMKIMWNRQKVLNFLLSMMPWRRNGLLTSHSHQ